MGSRILSSAALVASVGGCYAPDYSHNNVRCGGQNGQCPPGLVCGTEGFCQTEPANGGVWIQQASPNPPSPRRYIAFAHDEQRHQTVLFGGYDGITRLADTWEWDGSAWNTPPVIGAPTGRYGAVMAYDGQQLVMFSGLQVATSDADTWTYDGTTWTKPSGAGITEQRWYAAMAHDTARSRIVFFGGRHSPGTPAFGDTWEWDGAAASWTLRCSGAEPCASGPLPVARYAHAMAYDANRSRVVLFGGLDATDQRLGDTWEWDGMSWVAVCPGPCGVTARSFTAMAYDEARGGVVMFGGDDGAHQADTSIWDGTQWTSLGVGGPPPRSNHGMTYDSARGRLILFGGWDGGYLNDVWEL